MSCKNSCDPCGQPKCSCGPCVSGCLSPVYTNCVQLSKDLEVCGDVLFQGVDLTTVLESFATKLCGNIVVTASDIKTKASANDTTSGYLFEKIIGSNSVSITNSNIGADEKVVAAVKISATANNCLQVLSDGLYSPCSTGNGTTATTLVGLNTNSINTVVTPTPGGYSVQGNVKIDTTPNNALILGTNGLYVAPSITGTSATVSVLDTASIDMTVSNTGSNYTVSGQVRMDPASTIPYSFGPNGLKLDCCATGNTLLTTADTQSIDHTLTPVIGGYNLTSDIKIAPGATNALMSTPTGLFVPIGSNALVVNDTDSVDLTILPGNILKADVNVVDSTSVDFSVTPAGVTGSVKVDTVTGGNTLVSGANGLYVPSSAVAYSTNTCNAAHAGTDGNIFVQQALLPFALRIHNDGVTVNFEFSGTSNINTNYEVEFRGTTGAPLTWINGDGTYTSVTGGVLKYAMMPSPGAGVACEILAAKVRTKCANGVGEWVSITYDPAKDVHFTSTDNSIAIIQDPNGDDCGLYDLKLQATTPCASITAGDINTNLQYDFNDMNLLVAWTGANDHDMVSVKVDYTNISGNPAHVIMLVSTYNPTSARTVITLPFFGRSIPQTVTIQATRQCSILSPTVSSTYIFTEAYTPTACTDWVVVPTGILVNAWTPDNLQYRIEGSKIKFKGGVFKNFSSGPSLTTTGTVGAASCWTTITDDIFNTTGLALCGLPLAGGNANYGIKDHLYHRQGVYSYSSIVTNFAMNVDINFSLTKSGTMFQLKRDYFSTMDDDQKTHPGSMFSSANAYRNIYISFEDITIDLF